MNVLDPILLSSSTYSFPYQPDRIKLNENMKKRATAFEIATEELMKDNLYDESRLGFDIPQAQNQRRNNISYKCFQKNPQ